MSEFGINVLEIKKKLTTKQHQLEADLIDLKHKQQLLESEIEYVDRLLHEIKPVFTFVYAEEYLHSLPETTITTIKEEDV